MTCFWPGALFVVLVSGVGGWVEGVEVRGWGLGFRVERTGGEEFDVWLSG